MENRIKEQQLGLFAYLKDVLTRVAATPISQLDQLPPDLWKRTAVS